MGGGARWTNSGCCVDRVFQDHVCNGWVCESLGAFFAELPQSRMLILNCNQFKFESAAGLPPQNLKCKPANMGHNHIAKSFQTLRVYLGLLKTQPLMQGRLGPGKPVFGRECVQVRLVLERVALDTQCLIRAHIPSKVCLKKVEVLLLNQNEAPLPPDLEK